MTELFHPKFVDMVRVTTSTQGIGAFVCGPASQGFTSFAETLAVGDTFYYSAQGIDKPREREVGRGMLLANGTISREAMQGSLTNFTSGTKTIALVTSAEWYARLQVQSQNLGRHGSVQTRAALKLITDRTAGASRYLCEAGRSGTFEWDGAVPVSVHQSDSLEGVYVAPEPAAVGAWVRRGAIKLTPEMFGARGDNTTNDGPALQAWFDFGGSLHLPSRSYLSLQNLVLRRNVTVDGVGQGFSSFGVTGDANQPGSRLRFGAGAGLRIEGSTNLANKSAVDSAGSSAWTQEGAMGSVIRNVALHGPGTGAVATGCYVRTRVLLENVHVVNFQGHGFDISASADANDANSEYGNANYSILRGCRSRKNGTAGTGSGFRVRGRDANVILFDSCDATDNEGWGYEDLSLLPNTYNNCHSSGNTGGAYRGDGCTYVGCYHENQTIEGQCYLSNCTVIGGTLPRAKNNAVSAASLTSHSCHGRVGPTAFFNGTAEKFGETAIPGLAVGMGPIGTSPDRLIGYRMGYDPVSSTTIENEFDYGHQWNAGDNSFHWGNRGLTLSGWRDPTSATPNARAYARTHDRGIFLGSAWNVRLGSFNPNSSNMPDGPYQVGDTFFSQDTANSTRRMFRFAQATGVIASTAWAAGQQFSNAPGAPYAAVHRTNGGNVYRLVSIATPNAVASAAPVHTGGTVVGSDGYGWQFMNAVGAVTFADMVRRAPDTGWTAATGASSKGAFAASAAGTAGAAYDQAFMQATRDRIAATEARLVALETAVRSHGLIN